MFRQLLAHKHSTLGSAVPLAMFYQFALKTVIMNSKKYKTMARAKNIAVSVAAIHIREKSVAIWEQFPERGRAISHPFDIFQPLLKE